MRGHICKRGKNSYSLTISLGKDAATGKYKQQWVSVKGTKKDAEKRLAEILHQLDNGTFIEPGKTTLGEYLENWLKDYVRFNLRPKTAQGYQDIVRHHLIAGLGNVLLSQLKPEHVQGYYSHELERGLSAQSVRHYHAVLHKALESAVKLGMLARNPTDAISPPRVRRPEIQVWDQDDIARFLEAAKKTPYYVFFYTALYTGMRRNELLGLRWSDVDFVLCKSM